jgi:hypothetical protein
LQSAIDTAETRIASANSEESNKRTQELENQLLALNEENVQLSNQLLSTREEYNSLVAFIECEAEAEGLEDDKRNEALDEQLQSQNQEFLRQIEFLNEELNALRSQPQISVESEENRLQVEQLRSQLLAARSEAIELRMQSEELSARLAKYQGPSQGEISQSLTWEERKVALLHQLEAETRAEEPCDPRKVLEIEKILDETSREIARRDEELMGLRALLAQQSISQDGLAIGAAAIADVVEADAIIVAERLRLKELQAEWEQKHRQAEIEISLERAKIARERLELQERIQDIETKQSHTQGDSTAGMGTTADRAKSRGRWLARLGLRDE